MKFKIHSYTTSYKWSQTLQLQNYVLTSTSDSPHQNQLNNKHGLEVALSFFFRLRFFLYMRFDHMIEIDVRDWSIIFGSLILTPCRRLQNLSHKWCIRALHRD